MGYYTQYSLKIIRGDTIEQEAPNFANNAGRLRLQPRHPILVVDCTKRAVFTVNENQCTDGRAPEDLRDGILFSDFCEQALDEESLEQEEEQ